MWLWMLPATQHGLKASGKCFGGKHCRIDRMLQIVIVVDKETCGTQHMPVLVLLWVKLFTIQDVKDSLSCCCTEYCPRQPGSNPPPPPHPTPLPKISKNNAAGAVCE
eukprot:scpid109492/ scgid28232/ 